MSGAYKNGQRRSSGNRMSILLPIVWLLSSGSVAAQTTQSARASDALQAALSQPEVVEYGKQYGLEVKPSTAAQLAQMLKADADQWRGLIKQTGFTAES